MGDKPQPIAAEPDRNNEPRVSHPHTSFSQISTFLRCPMQYYYAYILRIKSPPNLAMRIGSGGHETLEFNGRHKIKTGADLDLPDILDLASTYIDNETAGLSPTDLKPGEKIGESKDRAIAALTIYRVRDAIKITPAGVEVEFNLDLNTEDEAPIRIINGKIDLITTDAGVEDYKFSGKMKSQADIDVAPQLSLYGRVFKHLTGKYPRKLGYRVFTPGNTKQSPDARVLYRAPELMTAMAQEKRFNRLLFQIRQVEKGIQNQYWMPTDNPQQCAWCGYRTRCQSSLVADDWTAAKIRGES